MCIFLDIYKIYYIVEFLMRYEWRQVGLIFSQSCIWLGLGFRIFCSYFHPVKARKERQSPEKDCCFPASIPWYFKAPAGLEVTLPVPHIPPQTSRVTEKGIFTLLSQWKLLRIQQRCRFSRAAFPCSGAEKPQRWILPQLVCSSGKRDIFIEANTSAAVMVLFEFTSLWRH